MTSMPDLMKQSMCYDIQSLVQLAKSWYISIDILFDDIKGQIVGKTNLLDNPPFHCIC